MATKQKIYQKVHKLEKAAKGHLANIKKKGGTGYIYPYRNNTFLVEYTFDPKAKVKKTKSTISKSGTRSSAVKKPSRSKAAQQFKMSGTYLLKWKGKIVAGKVYKSNPTNGRLVIVNPNSEKAAKKRMDYLRSLGLKPKFNNGWWTDKYIYVEDSKNVPVYPLDHPVTFPEKKYTKRKNAKDLKPAKYFYDKSRNGKMSDKTKAIRAFFKQYGFTSRDISVTTPYWGKINIVSNNPNVSDSLLLRIGKKFENISRDYATGEILSGGNTFVSIQNSAGKNLY